MLNPNLIYAKTFYEINIYLVKLNKFSIKLILILLIELHHEQNRIANTFQ